MKKLMTGTLLTIVLAASGCSSGGDGNEQSGTTSPIENIIVPDETNAGEPMEGATAPQGGEATEVPADAIPPAIRGRWGMVPADCTSTHGDAKGLLEISATDLVFYESRGRLGEMKEREPTRILADFAFSGEGMTWQRQMLLEVQDDGKTLIRRDYGDDTQPGPYRYSRCAA